MCRPNLEYTHRFQVLGNEPFTFIMMKQVLTNGLHHQKVSNCELMISIFPYVILLFISEKKSHLWVFILHVRLKIILYEYSHSWNHWRLFVIVFLFAKNRIPFSSRWIWNQHEWWWTSSKGSMSLERKRKRKLEKLKCWSFKILGQNLWTSCQTSMVKGILKRWWREKSLPLRWVGKTPQRWEQIIPHPKGEKFPQQRTRRHGSNKSRRNNFNWTWCHQAKVKFDLPIDFSKKG